MVAEKARGGKWRSQVDVLVVGAGVTGCAAAHQLQDMNCDYVLVERNVESGGLSRSISLGEAQFDYTGHFLHLQRYGTPSAIPYIGLNDSDWQRVDRRSCIYLDGNFVPAPFRSNLYHLPEHLRSRAINSFRSRSACDGPRSFSEYLLSGFGEEMCSLFLVPYNEKIQAIDLDKLSLDSVKRFFPAPHVDKIEAGCLEPATARQPAAEYNSSFWYPTRSGIGLLTRAMSAGLDSLRTVCSVTGIDIDARRARTTLGDVSFEQLLTSMPLKHLCMCTDDQELRSLGSGLSHNSVASINLLVKGRPPEDLSGIHWVYFPDRSIPFYRAGFYSNVVPGLVPKESFSMYVEIAVMGGPQAQGNMTEAVRAVVDGLDELGWISRDNVTTIAANWIDCAYVHFTHDRHERVGRIVARLAEAGITPIGRYGTWDYISMEDSISQGFAAAREAVESL